MSLGSATSRNNYTGDGSTTAFSYTFKIFADADLLVVKRTSGSSIDETMTLTTDYTVSGAGVSTGGTVTFTIAPENNSKISIIRNEQLTQDTDLRNQSTFRAQDIEDALDKSMMIDQRHQDQLDRTVKLAETDTSGFDVNLPPGATDAANYNRAVVNNASGTGFTWGPTSDDITTAAGASAALATWVSVKAAPYSAVGDGSTDDTTAIQSALTAFGTSGGRLWFPRGVYIVSSTLLMTLSSTDRDTVLYGEGVIRAKSDMTLDDTLVNISPSGNSLVVRGLTFDGNSRCNRVFQCDQASDATNSIHIDKCTFKNSWSEAAGDNSCLMIRGGYDLVNIRNSAFTDSTRKLGVSCETQGITISTTGGFAVKRVMVSDCMFKTITNNETSGSSENIDVDGLSIIGTGTNPGSDYWEGTVSIQNCDFYNCKGRSIKIQYDKANINNCHFFRDISGITGSSTEINAQIAACQIANCVFEYEDSASGEATHVRPGSPIALFASGDTGRDRTYNFSNIQIFDSTTTGGHSSVVEARLGATPTGNVFVNCNNITATGTYESFAIVTPYQAAESPLMAVTNIRACSVSKLTVGVVGMNSGSAQNNLNKLSISDFYNTNQPGTATITAATQADPVVITATAHGFSDGDIVYIYDVSGMTEINHLGFKVANSTANTFELNDIHGANIDGSGYTAYSSGGTAGGEVKSSFNTGSKADFGGFDLYMSNVFGVLRDNFGFNRWSPSDTSLVGLPKTTDTGGGTTGVRTYSINLADDAEYEIPHQGSVVLFMMASTFTENAQGFFYAQASSGVVIPNGMTVESLVDVDSAGTPGTNPDTDTKVNLWYSNSKLNIKNRLGSSRTFTFVFIGL